MSQTISLRFFSGDDRQTFDEWKSWYEAHAEPADPIEGRRSISSRSMGSSITRYSPAGCCTLTTLPRMTTSISSGGHGQGEGGEQKARLGYYQAYKI